MKIEKKCLRCQISFEALLYRNRKFCTEFCKKKFHEKKIDYKKCKNCDNLFPLGKLKVYCSKKCRTEDVKKSYEKYNNGIDISSATIGAIGELKVCIDLLVKGYNVYRSVSPACPCDLAITHKEKFIRVEVTTGHKSAQGKIFHNKKMDKNKFDVLAIVLKSQEIIYVPDLKEIN